MRSAALLFTWLLAVNLCGFFLMGIDKQRARRHAFRVPEAVLFSVALAFGSIGILAGIWVFRHKSAQKRFVFGIPAIILLQLLFVIVVWASDVTIYFL